MSCNSLYQGAGRAVVILAVTLGGLLAPRAVLAEDNTSTIISGVVSNHGAVDYFVGNTGTNNSLIIQSGGVLNSGNDSFIGNLASANNNYALVQGTGSRWNTAFLFFVGNSGSGNSLIISNGGAVYDYSGYIGSAFCSNNSVLVSGGGSLWNNTSQLYIGNSGSGNSLGIFAGGVVKSMTGYIGTSVGSSGNTVLVSGAGSVWSNSADLYVGYYGSGNSLAILNSGQVFSASSLLGFQVWATSNSVLVDGAGAHWEIDGQLTIGSASDHNQLTISDGGRVNDSKGIIGYDGAHNSVLVSGAGSFWSNSGDLNIGDHTAENRLAITNGGRVAVGGLATIGYASGASNNTVLVSTAGSQWLNSGSLCIGGSGANNALAISAGGQLSNSVGIIGNNSSAAGNSVLVTDPGSLWYNNAYLYIGRSGANNSLIISNGATVRNTMALVGLYAGADNNTVIVDGLGSFWVMQDIDFGDLSYGNQLFIRNGGVVSNQDVYVANSGGGNNRVVVDGAGSSWVTDALEFGEKGGGNTLILTNQGALISREQGYIGYRGDGNTAIVTGSGSVWSNRSSLYVGNYQASSNQLVIADGGAVYARSETYVGASDSSWYNAVQVTGTGSVWSNGQLSVGSRGSGNSVFVGTGSTLLSGWSYLGDYASSSNNTAVIGGGTWLNNSALVVGNDGGHNSLVISNAGLVETAGNAYFANSISSSNNTVLITGPGSTWEIGGQLFAGRNGGQNLLSVTDGGTLRTASLELNNATLQVDPSARVHVSGNFTQTVNGMLELGIGGTNAGEYAALQVDNRAMLDGTLSLVPVGLYTPQTNHFQRIIETSGGLTGTFATVQNALGGTLTPKLDYSDGYNVFVNWVLASFQPYAATPNQLSTASALDDAAEDPQAAGLLAHLGSLPGAQLPAALEQIAPEEFASLFQLGFAGMESFGHSLQGRLGDLRAGARGFSGHRFSLCDPAGSVLAAGGGLANQPGNAPDVFAPTPENPWGIYVEGLGEFIGVDGDPNAGGYDLTGGGFNLGLDRRLSEQLVIGLAAGYTGLESDLDNGGDLEVNRGQGALYALWFNQGAHAEAMVSGGFNDYQTRRLALGGTARGDTTGGDFGALLSGGLDLQKGAWSYGPWALLQYKLVHIASFTETGSLAPLTIQSQSADSLHSQLGAQISYRARCGRAQVVPSLRLAWRHEYLDDNTPVEAALANGAGDLFTVDGPSLGRDSLVVGLNFGVQWTPTLGSYLNYSTELGRDNYQPHSVNAGLRLNF